MGGSAPAGPQIVRMPGLQARPLSGGASIGGHAFFDLWPARRRILPRLLPSVDCQVEKPVIIVHRLNAAERGPVRFENI
jgi:hypothetical protein